MTAPRLIVFFGCLTVAACGRAAETPAATGDDHVEAAASPNRPAGAGEVRIEEEMMRDLRLTTGMVESRRGDEEITLLGELAVNEGRYAEVGVPVAARVVRLLAGVGETVREGQPLLELQSPEVGRARSAYATASARAALAETVLTRKRELAAERIAPQREVQEAEAEAASARAAVGAARAELGAIGLPLPDDSAAATDASHFSLVSPAAGVVIDRRALRGQMLDPSQPAFRIADLGTLWLTVHAFERDAVRVREGTSARVTFAALPGQTFTGRVTMIGREVASESRTVDVRIDVENRGRTLRPGMSASAALPIGTGSGQILAVPVVAVQRVGENWCVFLPKGDGLFEIRPIGRGRDLGTEIEVLSGLQAGDPIVVDGAFLLKSQADKSAGGGHDDH